MVLCYYSSVGKNVVCYTLPTLQLQGRTMSKLTKTKIANTALPLRRPGAKSPAALLIRDGVITGLYLKIQEGGSMSWIQRIQVAKRRRDIGLGSWPEVSIAEAREIAFENRRQFQKERSKLRRNSPSFRDVFEMMLEARSPSWKNPKAQADNWRGVMRANVMGEIGDSPIDAITKQDVYRILQPIWHDGKSTAKKVADMLQWVIAWAVEAELRDAPLELNTKAYLGEQRSNGGHHKALDYADVGAFLKDVSNAEVGCTAARLALQFVACTCVRSNEATGALWTEIDIAAKTWTVPATRMKTGREHKIPLSTMALDVLERARKLGDGDCIFPSPRKPTQGIATRSLSKLIEDMGLKGRATVHGLRASFRTWCADTQKDKDQAEFSLAHVKTKLEDAYNRSDLFELRRILMQEWADYLASTG